MAKAGQSGQVKAAHTVTIEAQGINLATVVQGCLDDCKWSVWRRSTGRHPLRIKQERKIASRGDF